MQDENGLKLTRCTQCGGSGLIQNQLCCHCKGRGTEKQEPDGPIVFAFIDSPVTIRWIDQSGEEMETQTIAFSD